VVTPLLRIRVNRNLQTILEAKASSSTPSAPFSRWSPSSSFGTHEPSFRKAALHVAARLATAPRRLTAAGCGGIETLATRDSAGMEKVFTLTLAATFRV
jgi:hypothetical protein